MSNPQSLGTTHGTPASAAARMSFACVPSGARTLSVIRRTSWPRRAATRASWSSFAALATLTPDGSSLELSGLVRAVMVKRPVSRSDLAMKPPLLPPAFRTLSVTVLPLRMYATTYANDSDVLDVVAGGHPCTGMLGIWMT